MDRFLFDPFYFGHGKGLSPLAKLITAYIATHHSDINATFLGEVLEEKEKDVKKALKELISSGLLEDIGGN